MANHGLDKGGKLLAAVGATLLVLSALSMDQVPRWLADRERAAGRVADSSLLEARWVGRGIRFGLGGLVLLAVGAGACRASQQARDYPARRMSACLSTARWIVLAPALWLTWWATIAAGIGLLTLANRACPPDLAVSGACVAPWMPFVTKAIAVTCAALAAALAVATAFVVAPSQRRRVVGVVFTLGTIAAVVIGWQARAPAESVAAVSTGWWVTRLVLQRVAHEVGTRSAGV